MKTALIIGAGPAGLTAASELLEKTDILPIVFEMSPDIGGISKTINYKGNYIDIGGHRFFSKSDRIMEQWKAIMPIQDDHSGNVSINMTTENHVSENIPISDKTDCVLLIRSRLSRIFYLRNFFNYPISLSIDTIMNLGIIRIFRILFSYIRFTIFPIKEEKTLEDFMKNHFGHELYNTFFKDYTEKVWGTKCSDISAEWGIQRIKGLSIGKALIHAIKKILKMDHSIGQKGTETSLIEKFLYPKYGPGQMWQETARRVLSRGGKLFLNYHVKSINIIDGKVTGLVVVNKETGEKTTYSGDYFFSTMPIKELIASLHGDPVPYNVRKIANNLPYRDFMTVGVLLNKLNVKTKRSKDILAMLPDNWIYIQEKEVKLARIQIFNNWSPYMVKSPDTVWIGLEYFCNEGDELWSKSDDECKNFAINELVCIDFINRADVIDSVVIRMPKAYPAYFGSYSDIHVIRNYTDKIENLFLIGRNGMHKYNNQDHSMLTAMIAVENIINGITSKDNIWSINAEQDYHEEK